MHIVDRQSVTQHLTEIIWRTMGYKLYDQYTIFIPAKSRMNWQPANGRVNMCSHIKAPLPPKVVRSIVWSLPLWVAAQSLNNSGESFTRQLQITFLILQQMQWKGNNGGVFPSLSMYWSCELHLGWFSFKKQPWFKFSRFEACRSVFEFACFETCWSVGNPPPGLTGYQRVPLSHFQYSQFVAQQTTFFSMLYIHGLNESGHDLTMWLKVLAFRVFWDCRLDLYSSSSNLQSHQESFRDFAINPEKLLKKYFHQ